MSFELAIDDKGSYPHTPTSPTPSSLRVWDIASEAILSPDATIGYWPKEMEEFAAKVGGSGLKGWMRDWVEGRSLVSCWQRSGVRANGKDELMARADVTSAFILTSSIAILASAQVSGTCGILRID